MASTMLSVGVLCFTVLFINNINYGVSLPTYIKPCDYDDKKLTECVKKQIENVLPIFTKGISELGVPPTDPVDLDNIVIDGNGLKLEFTKAKMSGLSGAKLTDLKADLQKSGEGFTLAFKTDLNVTADYEIDGKILILPIQGKGEALVRAQGIDVIIEGKLNHFKDDNGEHVKLSTPSYKYTITKTTFEFQNLFNGNKQLSDTTHQFANENWQQLMDDLAPPVIKKIVKSVIKAINVFFARTTVQELIHNYPKD